MVMSLTVFSRSEVGVKVTQKLVDIHVTYTPLEKMASSLLLDHITKLEVLRKLVQKSNGFAIDIGRTSIEG